MSCACEDGLYDPGNPTSWHARVGLFGDATPSAEIIGWMTPDPLSAFYQFLYEPSQSTQCGFSSSNGHRWTLLNRLGTVGFGMNDVRTVGDFATSPGTAGPVYSGAHYPRQAETVEFWASWYATTGPEEAFVNVDGECTALTVGRGTATNGAYSATVDGLTSGCHRYVFLFRDSNGAEITYPETGSFGLGPPSTCADWDSSRPEPGDTCQ